MNEEAKDKIFWEDFRYNLSNFNWRYCNNQMKAEEKYNEFMKKLNMGQEKNNLNILFEGIKLENADFNAKLRAQPPEP